MCAGTVFSLLRGSFGIRECRLKLLGLVEADGDRQAHASLDIVLGQLRATRLASTSSASLGCVPGFAPEARISIKSEAAGASLGLTFKTSLSTAAAAVLSFRLRWISASVW